MRDLIRKASNFTIKQNWLIVVLLLNFNFTIAQSFYKTYPSETGKNIEEIKEIATGYELTFSNAEIAQTDTSGNIIATESVPQLDFPPLNWIFSVVTILPNGDYLVKEDSAYHVLNADSVLLNTFTLPDDVPEIFGFNGEPGMFSNGDMLLPLRYAGEVSPFGLPLPNLGLVRVDVYTGNVIWFTDVDLGLSSGVTFANLTEIGENDEVYIAANNGQIDQYFVLKISTTGELLWTKQVGGASKFPKEMVITTDGDIWYIFNQVVITVEKRDGQTGEFIVGIPTDQILMSATTRDKLVATDDGGVICAGRLGSFPDYTTMYTLRVGAAGDVVSTNVLGNLSEPVDEVTAGLRLSSGEYVFAGDIDLSSAINDHYPFLVKLDENGAYVSDSIDGADLEMVMTASDSHPQIWTTTTMTLVIQNTGNEAASDVRVEFKKPNGVVYSGEEIYESSQGTFSFWSDEVWHVGTIAAGGSATLDVHYFMLTEDPQTAYAQVVTMSGFDVDSTPGNGMSMSVQEDDEALVELNKYSSCGNVVLDGDEVIFSGIDAPHFEVYILSSTTLMLSCSDNDCGPSVSMTDYPSDNYRITIFFYDENWDYICGAYEDVVIGVCENVVIETDGNDLSISGLSAAHVITKVWQSDGTAVLNCTDDCEESITLSDLSGDSYFVQVDLFDENWDRICRIDELVTITESITDRRVPTNQNKAFEPFRDLKLYPNPAVDYTNIEMGDMAGVINLQVITLQGIVVKSISLRDIQSPIYRLDISQLQAGMYMINFIVDGRNVATKRLIVGLL